MVSMDDPSDRRRAERVAVNAEFAELGDVTFVSDLSEHGVFVHTADLLPIGSDIDLRFTVLLDDPVVLVGCGRVVRHQQSPRGMGIKFVQLSPETILRLSDAVTRSRPRDLGPPIVNRDDVESAQTVVRARVPHLLKAKVEAGPPNAGSEAEEDFENSKTLVALRPVNAEIVDDDPDPDGSWEEER